MVTTLIGHVGDLVGEVTLSDALGKITALPTPAAKVAGSPLQALSEHGDGDRRQDASHYVNMVARISDRDELAPHRSGGVREELMQPCIMLRLDGGNAMLRRPHEVDEQPRDRMKRHAAKSARREKSC